MKKQLLSMMLFVCAVGNTFAQCTTPGATKISGKNIGCTNRVGVYSVSAATNATDYKWEITGAANFTRISATQYSIVFESTPIKITVTPMNGSCEGPKDVLDVAVSKSPGKPVLSQTGNTLSSSISTATSYQWYLNSTPIAGATTNAFEPQTNGTYTLEVKNGSGCSDFSDSFNFFKTAISEDKVFNALNFYPNPVITNMFISFPERYSIEIVDLSGKIVRTELDLIGKQEVNLSTLKRGFYLMRVTSNGKTAVRKLLLK